ncbi:MAG: formylmethanofuran dehydrogenase subunit E family protein [Candidatus Krumholzibacteria bacterium]|jgi:formylmethanofuran dehydrogenase subunit E|nr:formylmethanofuran dehydrogenase subunit E family protein [Candidatus Krumholzibacteria bacterium]MDY0111130.1 formylmethanofuran dehydrogenase subunit E family protein [Candidatus Krumholzibacteria bacterium]
MERICGHTYDEFLELARRFHGYPAPGLVAGGFMVDLALHNLPSGILFDAIAETDSCLPDAIQMLTPCTVGNGWLKVLDLGRYAICLYDKYEGSGVRVFADPARFERWPEVKTWLLKLKPKSEQDSALLLDQLREAGGDLFGVTPVRIRQHLLAKRSKGSITLCPACGEPFPARDGARCRGCGDETPYETKPAGAPDAVRLPTTSERT